MKILIIGDLHNRVDWVDFFLKEQESLGNVFDKRIFLGDYFDQFGDNVNDAYITARWIKRMLEDPRNILLMGNHDLAYAINRECTFCPGWDELKNHAVKNTLTKSDWDKVKIVHFEEPDLVFSHAGMLNKYFCHPVLGVTKEGIIKRCEEALEKVRGGIYDPVLCHWGRRGGSSDALGGIVWADWSELCHDGLVKGWTQIVGHTPNAKNPMIAKVDKDHINLCLDTHNTFYGTVINGKLDIHPNPNKPSYRQKFGKPAKSGMCDSGYGIG